MATARPGTLAFLDDLYGTADRGHLPIWTPISPTESETTWVPIDDPESAADAMRRLDDQGRNVYFGLGLHRRPLGPRRRGTADEVVGIPGFCVDVDIAGPAHKRTDLPPTEADAMGLVAAVPLAPTLVVDSGHGRHAWWLLREVLYFDDDEERAEAASVARRLQAVIRRAGQSHGWHVDATADLARVFRADGMHNRKPGLEPARVRVLSRGGRRYTIEELEAFLPDEEGPHDRDRDGRAWDGEARADFGRVLERCAFMAHCRTDAPTLSEPEWYGMLTVAARCRDGERWAHELSRDYAGYTREETQAKYEHARDADKPLRCATIERDLGGAPYCVACPERGKIKGPIVLGLPRTAPTYAGPNGRHGRTDEGEAAPGEPEQRRPRPEIDAGLDDLELVAKQAWDALRLANRPPRLFRSGGFPARIEDPEDEDAPLAQPLDVDRLRHELARAAAWYKETKQKGRSAAAPPLAVVRDMLAAPAFPLPSLLGIVQTPTFAPDGSLRSEPGYHPAGRTYYAPAKGLDVPPVPERPTCADVERAKRLILEELLGDFCFLDEGERANALSVLLDPYVRSLIDGPTPLRLIEAPAPGSGKGLLAEALLRPAVGRRVVLMPAAGDDDEWRKRLTAQLMTLPAAIVVDNVVKPLDSGALSAVLTASWWTDRRLGANEMVRVPVRAVFVMTGNNPTMSTELARRTVRIRLDPKVDRPWRRTGFRHEDLRGWADANRADLVWAALVLGRHWVAEGMPKGTVRLGSYERWAEVIGGVLGSAGVDGFLGNLEAFYESADREGETWREFVALWAEKHGEDEVGVADLFALAQTVDGFDFGSGSERAQKTAFGMALNRQRDRVVGACRVVNTRTVRRANMWHLIRAREGANPFGAFYRDGRAT